MRLHIALSLLVLFVGPLGCEQRETKADTDADRAKLDALYARYVSGNPVEAEKALQESLDVIASSGYEPTASSHARFMTFARLYVLADETGKPGEAEAYLTEARYWLIRKEELQGSTKAVAGTRLQEWTGDRVRRFVHEWNIKVNDGKPAAYRSAAAVDAKATDGGVSAEATTKTTSSPGSPR